MLCLCDDLPPTLHLVLLLSFMARADFAETVCCAQGLEHCINTHMTEILQLTVLGHMLAD